MEKFSFQATGFEVSAREHTQNTAGFFSPLKVFAEFSKTSFKFPACFSIISSQLTEIYSENMR